MAIGTNLKALLKSKNMTVKELSERSGVSVNTLYGIIQRDNLTIKPEIDMKLSDTLGIPSLVRTYSKHYSIVSIILDASHILLDDTSLYSSFEEAIINDCKEHSAVLYSEIQELKDDICIDKKLSIIYLCEPNYESMILEMLVRVFKQNPDIEQSVCKYGLSNYEVDIERLLEESNDSSQNEYFLDLIVKNVRTVKHPANEYTNTSIPPYTHASFTRHYKLNNAILKLNDKGIAKAIEQIELLAQIPKYQADNNKTDSSDSTDNNK
jgi:transcriptional regulator with XRE-family HTH domain